MVEEARLSVGFDAGPAESGAKAYARSAEDIKRKAADVDKQVNGTSKAFRNAGRAANDNVRSTNRLSRAYVAATRNLRGMGRQIGRVSRRFAVLSRVAGRALRSLRSGLIGITALAGSIGGALTVGGAVRAFANFEEGLVSVQKTTDLADADLQRLGERIRGFARELPVTTAEFLDLAVAAGQLGVRGEENIARFAQTLGQLQLTTDGLLQGQQAARDFAQILNITNTPIDQVDRLGSAVTDLGNNFATTERDIVESSLNIAQAVAEFGGDFTAQQVVALGTALSSLAINPELGRSAVVGTFDAIKKGAFQAGKEAQILALVLQQTQEETRRLVQEDPSRVFRQFVEALTELNEESRIEVLDQLGLAGRRLAPILATLGTRVDILTAAFETSERAWEQNIALQKEALKQATTFTSQMKITGNVIDEAASVLGSELAPVILEVATEFRNWLIQLKDTGRLRQFAETSGKNFRAVVNIVAELGRAFGAMASLIARAEPVISAAIRIMFLPLTAVVGLINQIDDFFTRRSRDTAVLADGLRGQIMATVPLTPDMLPQAPQGALPVPGGAPGAGRDILDQLPGSESDSAAAQAARQQAALDTLQQQVLASRDIQAALAAGDEALARKFELNLQISQQIASLGLEGAMADEFRRLAVEQAALAEANDRLQATISDTTAMEAQAGALRDLSQRLKGSGLSADEMATEIDLLSRATSQGIDLTTEYGQEWLAAARSLNTAQKEIDDLVDAQRKADIALEARKQAVEDVFRDISDEASDAFKGVIKGTESVGDAFQNLADRITDILLDLALQELLTGGTGFTDVFTRFSGGAGGGAGGGGGLLGDAVDFIASLFHKGGIAGQDGPTRHVSAAAFVGAPRFHEGTFPGLRADEVPAILQRGEVVLSRQQVANADGSGVVINMGGVTIQAPTKAAGREAANEVAARTGAAAQRAMIRKGLR